MKEYWIKSIGLDIGTSTTKFVVSRLQVKETGGQFSLPSCQIVDRKVQYASRIYTTPLKNHYEINIEQLKDILNYEYEKSGIDLHDIKAGAVIITGETARKDNAEAIIHYLAERAGDFVVAAAGPDLEGILAGKGSGAMNRSKEIKGVVANVDIGGGTANIALFQQGKVLQTLTFHIGGRLIRLQKDGMIDYISDHIVPWLTANHFHLGTGMSVDYDCIQRICHRMSEALLSLLCGSPEYAPELLLLQPTSISLPPIDEVIFSGGIGQMLTEEPPEFLEEVTRHGDIGPLLAAALKIVADSCPVRVGVASETTRATVIGAGMQNTEICGATVYVKESLLPKRNVPIVKVKVDPLADLRLRISEAMKQARNSFDTKQETPLALGLTRVEECTYAILQDIADSIYYPFIQHFPEAQCLIVICESDMAKALGQALAKRCKERLEVLCIDQIDFTYGDYIDLGLPVAGEAIPVSIKTLAFV
ncbi:ethanolamine ammonia-lyase reactivating factor EutA [Neobacillus vireti]|uniref:ethanolamine ammonia-lyase reactivating factor EutA n=1 Tax=Neobacillus vireti TaxID=220686 RepID=UPI002FFF7564